MIPASTASRALSAAAAMALALAAPSAGAEQPAPAAARSVVLAAAPDKPAARHGIFKFSSYPAAWTAAQKSNRPILIFATSPHCPHCVRMIGETLRTPHVNRFLNDSFETVYADRLEQPELTAKLGIRRFPTTIVVGPDNQVIDVLEGYVDAKTLAQRLRTTVAAHPPATQTR
ncbi:MAG: thioredoxin family protein [Pirellulales bacterium]|nr:thioredoxin family protein [Pirellulales bacterium]